MSNETKSKQSKMQSLNPLNEVIKTNVSCSCGHEKDLNVFMKSGCLVMIISLNLSSHQKKYEKKKKYNILRWTISYQNCNEFQVTEAMILDTIFNYTQYSKQQRTHQTNRILAKRGRHLVYLLLSECYVQLLHSYVYPKFTKYFGIRMVKNRWSTRRCDEKKQGEQQQMQEEQVQWAGGPQSRRSRSNGQGDHRAGRASPMGRGTTEQEEQVQGERDASRWRSSMSLSKRSRGSKR